MPTLLCVLAFVAFAFSPAYGQQCNKETQCYPVGYVTGGVVVPRTLINCSADGECVCRECFYFDEDEGNCAIDEPCQTYDTSDNSCSDHRRSQLVAVVLACVCSVFGAANFYIARYEYAVPQLGLLVCLIVASVFGRILQYFSEDKGRSTEKFCALCTTVTAAVVAILALLTIIAWWLADIAIFVMNDRRDGDNCPLSEDL